MSAKKVKALIHILKIKWEVELVELLSLKECLERLGVLAEQANKDGKKKVYEFISHLIDTDIVDVSIFRSIYDYYDSLNDEDVPVFEYLLNHNAHAEWYNFVEFLSDQRGNVINYYDIIVRAIENGLSCKILMEFEKDSSDLKDFETLVNDAIKDLSPAEPEPKEEINSNFTSENSFENEFIAHLKKENEQLNLRLDNTLKELNGYRDEQKNVMEASIADKHAYMNSKIEVERLQKSLKNKEAAFTILEKKFKSQKDMIAQLGEINSNITKENESLTLKLAEIEHKFEELNKECAGYKSEHEIQRLQIETLEKEIASLRSMGSTRPGIFREADSNFLPSNASQLTGCSEIQEQELYNEDSYFADELADNIVDEPDYVQEDVIQIQGEKELIKKHSGIFSSLVEKLFVGKFEHKSVAEQENLIFIKLMENGYAQDTLKAVKMVMKADRGVSRTMLYKMLYNHETDSDVVQYCNSFSLSA